MINYKGSGVQIKLGKPGISFVKRVNEAIQEKGYQLDGTNELIELNTPFLADWNTEFTEYVILKRNVDETTSAIVDNRIGPGEPRANFIFFVDDTVWVTISDSEGNSISAMTNKTFPNSGVYILLGYKFSIDGADRKIDIFDDTGIITTVENSNLSADIISAEERVIGARANYGGSNNAMNILRYGFATEAISDAHIADLANRTTLKALGYNVAQEFDMNQDVWDGVKWILQDISGNGRNGQSVNMEQIDRINA
jgi:hypothetical protein